MSLLYEFQGKVNMLSIALKGSTASSLSGMNTATQRMGKSGRLQIAVGSHEINSFFFTPG